MTHTLQCVPTFTPFWHLFTATAKGPETDTLDTTIVAFPVFSRATTFSGLVVPTGTEPKFRLVGDTTPTGCGGVTVNASVVVSVKLPDVPVTVTVAVPVVVVPLAVSVNVLVLVAGFGLKASVTPSGKPDADNKTVPLNPFTGVMVIVLVP